LLLQALGTSRSAWAGCNQLVSSHENRTLHFHQLDALITGDVSVASDDMARDPVEDPRSGWPSRCSGPECSSRVPSPLSTAVPDVERTDRWGDWSHLAIPQIDSPSRRTIGEPDARPIAQKPAIFHPPPV
jgi:hypothetical protein